MLTDDDLTRQLGAAFRGASDDLTYGGRVPNARRTPVWASAATVALPVAAAATVGAVLLTGGAAAPTARDLPSAGHASGAPTTVTTSDVAPTAPGTDGTVVSTIEFAGYSLTYRHAADDGPVVTASLEGVVVPDWAHEIDVPKQAVQPAQAWVGTDPDTGDAVLFLKAVTRNEGELFSLTGGGLDEDGLVDLLYHGHRD